MRNKKVIILLCVLGVSLIGGSIIYSNFVNKPKIDVSVTETSEIEKVEHKDKDKETADREENKDEEQSENSEELNETEDEITDESLTPATNEVVYEQEKQEDKPAKESAVKDAGNGVIKSTYVKIEDTGNSRTYMGVTGGDADEHFYDFEQFDFFLNLIGEEVPTGKDISHQGSVHTAYYENGMYVTYNSKSDKMVVVKGVYADEEVE